MEWWYHMPAAFWCVWVFALGLIVGSFLNVAIARLPYGKSILWPGSRCGSCHRPLKLRDNLPILGYLILRGRCRFCRAAFSSRYLWVELATGLVFVGLFVVDVLSHANGGPDWLTPWHPQPGAGFRYVGGSPLPPWPLVGVFLAHAALAACLIAAAVIDANFRVIPPVIPYLGTALGVVASVLLPWPAPAAAPKLNPDYKPGTTWMVADAVDGPIPHGVMPWPALGPPPDWAPAGSWKLGLLSSLAGAAAGTGLVRGVKFVFEKGMRREALGLGDADLLMMCGAFLGWQVVVLGFGAGAFAGLALKLPGLVRDAVAGRKVASELPFGPGLALGVALTWLGWPWLPDGARLLFEPVYVAGFAVVMAVGMYASGLLLRRGPDTETRPA